MPEWIPMRLVLRRHPGRSPLISLAPLLISVTLLAVVASCSSDSDTGTDAGGTGTDAADDTPDSADSAEEAEDAAAASEGDDEGDQAGGELFPDVVDASATRDGDGTWTFSATLSSPYDSAERYADAWRVVGPDGTVYGTRELLHDHANEQPFTRSQSGIEIPDDVDEVTVEGRDQVSGWGGATVAVTLDRS